MQNRKWLINGSNGSLTRYQTEEGNNDNKYHQHYDHNQLDDDHHVVKGDVPFYWSEVLNANRQYPAAELDQTPVARLEMAVR